MPRGRTPNSFSLKFGKRIRDLRQDRNWTQVDMSAHTGIERGHISEIECGKRIVNLLTLQTLAACFDMTMSALLKGM